MESKTDILSTFLTHPKISDLMKLPPRKLTPQLLSLVKMGIDLNPTVSKIWQPIVFNYALMVFIAVILFFTPMKLSEAILLTLGLLIFGLLFHAIFLFIKYRRTRRVRFLLINGSVTVANVLNNKTNWQRQVNNAPQRIIQLEIDGRKITFKTYDHDLADEFADEVAVIYHPNSHLIMPLSYFIKYEID